MENTLPSTLSTGRFSHDWLTNKHPKCSSSLSDHSFDLSLPSLQNLRVHADDIFSGGPVFIDTGKYFKSAPTSPTPPRPFALSKKHSLSLPKPPRGFFRETSIPKGNDGRSIYYHIADEFGEIEEELKLCMTFKGNDVHELTNRLEGELGIDGLTVCIRSPLNGKLHPLWLQLPPGNSSMHIVVVPPSSKGEGSNLTEKFVGANGGGDSKGYVRRLAGSNGARNATDARGWSVFRDFFAKRKAY